MSSLVFSYILTISTIAGMPSPHFGNAIAQTQNATAVQNNTESVTQVYGRVYGTYKLILAGCTDEIPELPSQFIAQTYCRVPGVRGGDLVIATIDLQPPGAGGLVITIAESQYDTVNILAKNLASVRSNSGSIHYALMIFQP